MTEYQYKRTQKTNAERPTTEKTRLEKRMDRLEQKLETENQKEVEIQPVGINDKNSRRIQKIEHELRMLRKVIKQLAEKQIDQRQEVQELKTEDTEDSQQAVAEGDRRDPEKVSDNEVIEYLKQSEEPKSVRDIIADVYGYGEKAYDKTKVNWESRIYKKAYNPIRNLTNEGSIEKVREGSKKLYKVKQKEEAEEGLDSLAVENQAVPQREKNVLKFFKQNRGKRFSVRDLMKKVFDITDEEKLRNRGSEYSMVYKAAYELEKDGILETHKEKHNSGVRLRYSLPEDRDISNIDRSEKEEDGGEEDDITCSLCGQSYKSTRGLGGHLRKTHGINSKEHRLPISKLFSEEHDVEPVKDSEEGEGSEKEEDRRYVESHEDFSELNNGEPISDPQYISIEERRAKITEALNAADIPLTKSELVSMIYNLSADDEGTDHGSTHYNAIVSAMDKLIQNEDVIEADRMGTGQSKAWELPAEEESESDESESSESKGEVSDLSIAQRKSGVGDRELESIENSIRKNIMLDGNTKISYYNFEKRYGGSLGSLQAWQKLFEHTPIMEEINRRVAPENQLVWTTEGGQGGVKNWELEVVGVEE